MKQRYNNFIILALTLSLGTSILFSRHYKAELDGIAQESHTDTTNITAPAPKDSIVIRWKPVYLPAVPDTVLLHDTLEVVKTDSVKVYVPITQKKYEDEKYTAWVSGYRPSLDSIQLRIPTTVITRPEKTSCFEWSIGVQAGAAWVPQHGIKPYVGVGVQFGIPLRKIRKKKINPPQTCLLFFHENKHQNHGTTHQRQVVHSADSPCAEHFSGFQP